MIEEVSTRKGGGGQQPSQRALMLMGQVPITTLSAEKRGCSR
jgi:hypothetical protein